MRRRRTFGSGRAEVAMLDLAFVLVTLLFFALSVGYVTLCDRLMPKSEKS